MTAKIKKPRKARKRTRNKDYCTNVLVSVSHWTTTRSVSLLVCLRKQLSVQTKKQKTGCETLLATMWRAPTTRAMIVRQVQCLTLREFICLRVLQHVTILWTVTLLVKDAVKLLRSQFVRRWFTTRTGDNST